MKAGGSSVIFVRNGLKVLGIFGSILILIMKVENSGTRVMNVTMMDLT